MTNIGGRIDMTGLGQLLGDRPDAAQQHRPQTRPEFIREARRLRAAGLTVDDIATALKLSLGAVRELLREPPPGELHPRYRRPDL
jgi:hypothetical protein